MLKMKKLVSLVLTAAMVLSLCMVGAWAEDTTGSGEDTTGAEAGAADVGGARSAGVAAIGSQSYDTLEAAITAIGTSDAGTVTVLNDTTESVTIPEGADVTLDLNGKTLTNAAGDNTITNNGTLTVTGTGTVDNTTHGKAALVNNGTATLSGGTFTRSADTGVNATTSGGNSFYTLKNTGYITLEAGVTIENKGHFSSTVTNVGTRSKAATMIINGGNFTGGVNTIKNDDYGVLTINGGTFTNDAGEGLQAIAVQNWNISTINGGTFTSTNDYALCNGSYRNDVDAGKLTINGGIFTAPNLFVAGKDKYPDWGDITIEGGNFTGEIGLPDKGETAASLSISGGTFSDLSVLDYLSSSANVTVELNKDVTLAKNSTINASSVILDLNGKTINTAGYNMAVSSGKLTIDGNGTMKNEVTGSVSPLVQHSMLTVNAGANLVINNGTFETAAFCPLNVYGTAVINDGSFKCTYAKPSAYDNGVMIYVSGANAKLTMLGGSISMNGNSDAIDCGLYGAYIANGATAVFGNAADHSGPTIASNSAAIGTNNTKATADITVNGGTYTSTLKVAENNAWQRANAAIYMPTEGSLNITGGTFIGTDYAISFPYAKADYTLNISGGKFTSTKAVIYNGQESGGSGSNTGDSFSISGGYFTSDPATYVASGYKSTAGSWNGYSYKVSKVPENKLVSAAAAAYKDTAKDSDTEVAVSISGTTLSVVGKIPAADTKVTVTYTRTDGTTGTVDIANVDGTFAQPSAVTVGTTAYTFDISQLSVMPAAVAVQAAAPKAETALPTTATEAEKEAANAVVESIAANATAVDAAGLSAAATQQISTAGATAGVKTESGTVITATDTTVASKLETAGLTASEGKEVVIVAQPYLDIKVASLNIVGDNSITTLALNIEPMYNVVAVVKNTDAAVPTINTTGTDGAKNVAVVAEAQPMTVNTSVDVSIPLPENLAVDAANFFVKHEHTNANGSVSTYYYKATVTDTNPRIATFTVPNGFSTFTFTSDTRSTTIDFTDADSSENYNLATVGTTFPTVTKDGYRFTGWKFTENGDAVTDATGTYTEMTDALLTALNGKTVVGTAQFTQNSTGSGSSSSSTYTITASAGANGSISPSGKTSVATGKSQTYTITANTGYVVDDVTVDGKSVGSVTTYTFSNVKAAHTISATFKAAAVTLPYTDVTASHWAIDEITWAYTNGYITGTSSTTFSPNGTVTRQQLWMVLARLDGVNPANMSAARDWAMSAGISNGKDATAAVSRQQMVTMLYRYASMKGYDLSASGSLSAFPDSASVASYAKDAMTWAVGSEIISGMSGNLAPAGDTTRAQFATILYRFCSHTVK